MVVGASMIRSKKQREHQYTKKDMLGLLRGRKQNGREIIMSKIYGRR